MTAPLRVGDLYAGGGGSSEGLYQACADLDVDFHLTLVNHWDRAIETQRDNHPQANCLRAEVDKLRYGDLSKDGALDILWASPACTEHSYAKGGHSIDDQNRHSAFGPSFGKLIRWTPATD